MDTWPTDDRNDTSDPVHRKGKGKFKEKEITRRYPHLNYGSLNAVSLHEKNGRLEWTSIVNHENKDNALVRAGKAVTVFPPTRPLPLHIPRTTILQRAEQGANFLRTYLPDADIAAELIRDKIAEDAQFMRKLEAFDPYMGNLLDSISRHDSISKRTAFLAFPMGELNRDLNISPFSYTQKGQVVFKPLASPVRTFETPIQQVVSSKPLPNGGKQDSYLAVRTFASTSLLEVKTAGTARSTYSARLTDLTSIVPSDVGSASVIDIKLSSSPLDVVVVNDQGAVYKCDLDKGQKKLQLVYPAMDTVSITAPDLFWRIAPAENRDTYFLASSKVVKCIDFRSNGSASDLFSIQRPGEVITCIESPQPDHMIRFSSTSEVFWIDQRFPGKPLLGYKHGRQFDRTLDVQTIYLQDTPLTFLSSRMNGLVSVYDVSRSSDQLIHVRGHPYCLPFIMGSDVPHTGQAFFRHPADTSETRTSLFRLSGRGSIHRLDLEISPESQNASGSSGFEWLADITALETQTATLRTDVGPLGGRDLSEADIHPIYDNIFREYTKDAEVAAEEASEAVYELIDRVPSYWQESNDPVEHMLTTFDVVFRSGDEPARVSRADFLTQSVINSTRGYRALVQGRLSAQPLIKHAMWHHSIVPTLQRLDASITGDVQTMVDHLCRYNLAANPDRSAQSIRRELEAREQLALDLVLSTNIFSAQPFAKPLRMDSDLETMSRATEALSIGGEPPPIDFGYLHPVRQDAITQEHSGQKSLSQIRDASGPLGVRLLLKEWEIGTRPRDFTYVDPYDGLADLPPIRHSKYNSQATTNPTQTIHTTQHQRPPLVMASSSLAPSIYPDMPRRLPFGGLSQGPNPQRYAPTPSSQPPAVDSALPSTSQDCIASTQILPGPYGGRPPLGKKKIAKKRLGGF